MKRIIPGVNMEVITIASLADLRASEMQADVLMKYLPESSRQRLGKISNPDSRDRSLLGELLSRYSLKLVTGLDLKGMEYSISEKGKPGLHPDLGIHFNISHSAELVACVVSASEVGIDLEHIRRVNFKVAERFFSDSEICDLKALNDAEQLNYFFVLWTIKESFLKAIGSGLTRNLNSFTVMKDENGYRLTGESAEEYSVYTMIPKENYCLSVCSRFPGSEWRIMRIDIKEIIESLGISA